MKSFLQFEKDINFNSLTKDDVFKIIENENKVHFKINNVVIASPTESEIKVVETKSGKDYSEYLIDFLSNNSITDICNKYGAERKEDIPLCIAMAIFESV